ncbi:MAG: DUF177 domain-containing protein [Gemmatimonadetes bacterium]|nr:DUF177 domain-containing protein [Gemmatimonadota bacterium]
MLRVGLATLEQGPVDTAARLAADDPLFEGLGIALHEPVVVSGQIAAAGPDSFFWRGMLETSVGTTCRRCLTPVVRPVAAKVDVLFSEDPESDDQSVYLIPPDTETLDLSPAVREELILAAPDYILCREDCRGLCPRCGKDLNEGPCDCGPEIPDPRWSGLAALKQRLEKER